MKKGATVFVGVSGGVDSSVAAYLLKEQGYDVHGIFVKTWSPEWLPCTWVAEKRDAMRVCAHLDIPFHFLDAEDAYRDGVAQYMIDEYKAGRTPNPDVLCNRVIKFGVMWEYAKAHGASFLATGHYAQQIDGVLMRGADESKDQSYFLWMITKEELAHVLFPIGAMPKSTVREIATKAGLMTATKKDSQGICFLGDVDMREFLSHYIEEKPGVVVTRDGTVVGTHDGVWFHTLGSRHGFTITEPGTDRTPYYVVDKHIDRNELVVAHDVRAVHPKGEVTIRLRDTNWMMTAPKGNSYLAQLRYHGAHIPVRIIDGDTIALAYDEVIPLGQSVVIYHNDMLVGGGIIDAIDDSSNEM
jgi:tRNA-uridine 2-sulfurtransferase